MNNLSINHLKDFGFFANKSVQNAKIMGILNLTPDSFSDGSKFAKFDDIYNHIMPWIEKGIDYIDIGAESTRPGGDPVSADIEFSRLYPTLEQLSKIDLDKTKISIDSRHLSTQVRCLDYDFVKMINYVLGLMPDHELKSLKNHKNFKSIELLFSHFHGKSFKTMQKDPLPKQKIKNVLTDYFKHCDEKLSYFDIKKAKIFLDPGIGFGKSFLANIEIFNIISDFTSEYNICIGLSRKSFLNEFSKYSKTEVFDLNTKDLMSKIIEYMMMIKGVKLIRTHHPLAFL